MTHVLALDFDETIAPTYQAIVPPWDAFMATWLVAHGLYKTEEEARAAYTFQNEYGCGPTYFAKKFGKNIPWVEAFYQASAPLLLQAAVEMLKPDAELRRKLITVRNQGTTLAVITQAHRDYALPLLRHLDLADILPPHLVVDRAHKRLSPNGFLQLRHLTAHLAPHTYTMVDDGPENLLTAHDCGYRTILLAPEASERENIDATFPSLHAYLDTLL